MASAQLVLLTSSKNSLCMNPDGLGLECETVKMPIQVVCDVVDFFIAPSQSRVHAPCRDTLPQRVDRVYAGSLPFVCPAFVTEPAMILIERLTTFKFGNCRW